MVDSALSTRNRVSTWVLVALLYVLVGLTSAACSTPPETSIDGSVPAPQASTNPSDDGGKSGGEADGGELTGWQKRLETVGNWLVLPLAVVAVLGLLLVLARLRGLSRRIEAMEANLDQIRREMSLPVPSSSGP